jgi:hypothetical protein
LGIKVKISSLAQHMAHINYNNILNEIGAKTYLHLLVNDILFDESELYLLNSDIDKLPYEERMRISVAFNQLKNIDDNEEIPSIILPNIDYDDVKDIRVEWATEGIVYGKVLGHKKSYKLTIPMNNKWAIIYEDGFTEIIDVNIPNFEVMIDMISVLVRKTGKKIRRFYQWRGKINVFLRIDFENGEVKRLKIGEISVDWKGHKELSKLAKVRLKFLAKELKRLEKMVNKATGPKRRKLQNTINKIEQQIRILHKARQRHYVAALQIHGYVGDYKIRRRIWIKKRSMVVNNVVVRAPVAPKTQKISFGNQEVIVLPIKQLDINNYKTVNVFTVNKKFTFYGKFGKLNHELRVLATPKRKVTVPTYSNARESVFRQFVRTTRNPVKVTELIGDAAKVWVIVPLRGVARVELINRDHRHEGLDRILVHLHNQVLVFIHRL